MIDSTRQWVSSEFPVSASASRSDSTEELMDVVQDSIPRTLLGGSGALDENAWESVSLALLWRLLRTRMQQTPNGCQNSTSPVRHRDLLLAASSEDSDRLVHEVLIQFCSVFLDQGYAIGNCRIVVPGSSRHLSRFSVRVVFYKTLAAACLQGIAADSPGWHVRHGLAGRIIVAAGYRIA